MLLKILDETMAKAAKYENLTRASKFGSKYFESDEKQSPEKELLMLKKISQYVKEEETEKQSLQDKEISEYIVENEEKNVKIFDLKARPYTGLPFFKSITYKLSESFGV